MGRVFLLSPANASGKRMGLVLRAGASFPLARAVQGDGASLGAVFQFASGLYFRGKWAYAQAFGHRTLGSFVIAPGAGLLPPQTVVTAADLERFGAVEVDEDEPRFTTPLREATVRLVQRLGRADEVVLLGSVATGKYTRTLLEVLGPRLLFPRDFVGRGDMSRGGLMLRAAASGEELVYQPVQGAVLHGPRAPRLEKKASPGG